MGYRVNAVYENGVLRPLKNVDLDEHQQVQITVEPNPTVSPEQHGQQGADPLEEVRSATGLSDLAEHFDDYRFGHRTP